jgi:putative metallohydrolase (TIGR04338 family)
MRRPRDNQRSKLYRWEASALGLRDGELLRLAECQMLADTVCRVYRTLPVRVADGRGHSNAVYYEGSHWTAGNNELYRPPTIALPRRMRRRGVVLHELAHHLTPKGCAPHGPEFVWVMIHLLERFGGEKRTEMRASAKEAGLKISRPRSVGGRVVKRA